MLNKIVGVLINLPDPWPPVKPKAMSWWRCAAVMSLGLAIFGSILWNGGNSAKAAPTIQYSQGFEIDNDWGSPGPTFDDPTRVASGTNGITSRTGGFHAEAVGGNFTRFGGYNSVFPANGYTTSIDIFLNTSGGYANDTRFDWSSAINDTTGTHRRDFIFHGGFYSDGGPYGSGDRFVFTVSNNAPGWPRDPSRGPVVVASSGWYTLKHTFLPGAGGRLVVKMELIDAANNPIGTWSLSDPTDIIGSTVGGNRYGWL
ncbi:MAG: hypothetical protein AB7J13_17145, partial [Pyrinomonadaceae bacterium]